MHRLNDVLPAPVLGFIHAKFIQRASFGLSLEA